MTTSTLPGPFKARQCMSPGWSILNSTRAGDHRRPEAQTAEQPPAYALGAPQGLRRRPVKCSSIILMIVRDRWALFSRAVQKNHGGDSAKR
jgi:hypothetical protein